MTQPVATRAVVVPPLRSVISAAGAPLLLIGGWTWAAASQPAGFDAVTQSISALAANEADARWIMTSALYGVGACHIVTASGLRTAKRAGRMLQAFGGFCTLLVAATPLREHTSPVLHMLFATAALGSLALWPVLALRREVEAPALLRPRAALTAAGVLSALLLWLVAEMMLRTRLGLAERVAAGAQAVWPLAVVLSSRRTQAASFSTQP